MLSRRLTILGTEYHPQNIPRVLDGGLEWSRPLYRLDEWLSQNAGVHKSRGDSGEEYEQKSEGTKIWEAINNMSEEGSNNRVNEKKYIASVW